LPHTPYADGLINEGGRKAPQAASQRVLVAVMQPRKSYLARGGPVGDEPSEREVYQVKQVRDDLVLLKLRARVDCHAQIALQRPHLGLGYYEACPKKPRLGDMRTEHPLGNDLRPYFEWLSASRSVANSKAAVKGIQSPLDTVRETHEPLTP
jgi:hypothetical protein